MNISSTINNIKKALGGENLYTQSDLRNRLEYFARSKRGMQITAQLLRQTDSLTKKDIGSWRQAWQAALSITNPNRMRLYDIYADCMVDGHLSGAISQRKGMVVKNDFRLVDKQGKENSEASELLHREWFIDFLELALDSRYWGHSLIEFGEAVRSDKGMTYTDVKLVPRKHVIPEYGVFVRQQGDEPSSGISYRDGEYAQHVVEVGKPNNLGLLLGAAPSFISKKNMLCFWDLFGEIFGAPMRIAKSSTTDASERAKLEQSLANMGSDFWALLPEGTDIDIVESTRGDAFNVFDRRIDRANSEMSKHILNQTMTIDSGSSLSQSEVHLEVFENVVKADKRMLSFIINDRLLPMMANDGFPVAGLSFRWDETTAYTPAELREFLRVALQYYHIPKEYFTDNFGIPIDGEREQGTAGFFE